jgi:RNA polymerase sigma-70 factor (ECF subfamily)
MPATIATAGWPGVTFGAAPGPARTFESLQGSLWGPESPATVAPEAPPAPAPAPAGLRVADDDLVARLLARDEAAEAALAELYERYAGAVYGLALRMLSDAPVAEEVLQETFWRLWRYAGHYQAGRVRFVTWLLRVATNLAISEQRKRARRPRTSPLSPQPSPGGDGSEHAPAEVVDPDPEVPDQVWRGEQRRMVTAGLATLPAVQREAVELAYFKGLTHAEIAATQGAPLSTVKTRLALGLRKLADFLVGRGVSRADCLG